MDKNKKLALSIVVDIAEGLQQFVYNRQEGDHSDPKESIISASFIQVNTLLKTTAAKYGVSPDDLTPSTDVKTDASVDPDICANENKASE